MLRIEKEKKKKKKNKQKKNNKKKNRFGCNRVRTADARMSVQRKNHCTSELCVKI